MNMSRLCVCDTVTCDASTYIAYKLLLVNCVADVLRTVFVCKDIFASQDFSACRITTSHKTQLLHTSCGSILWSGVTTLPSGCDNPTKNSKGNPAVKYYLIAHCFTSGSIRFINISGPTAILLASRSNRIGSDSYQLTCPLHSPHPSLLFFPLCLKMLSSIIIV